MSSFRPNLGPPVQWRIFFHWAKLHPTELHCILLSYAAPLHSLELHCTLLSCAEFNWATPHPMWAKLHPLSQAASFWARLHPSELRCTLSELGCAPRATVNLQSYATAFWGTLHPSELRCTLLMYTHSCTDPTSEINDTYVEKTQRNVTAWQKNPP